MCMVGNEMIIQTHDAHDITTALGFGYEWHSLRHLEALMVWCLEFASTSRTSSVRRFS
jgi:hypothetical protein